MAAKDAKIQPIYGCKHRETFELLDSDGAPVSPSSPDSEISKDCAAFTDAGNEATEINAGECYLDFDYDETQCKTLRVRISSTGALYKSFTLFPRRLPVLDSGTAQAGGAAQLTLAAGASNKDGAYVGCFLRLSNNTPAGVQGDCHKILTYNGTTKVATVDASWTDTPTSSTTYEILVPESLAISSLLVSASELQAEMEEDGASLLDTVADAVAAIQAKTDNLPADPAGTSDIPTVTEIQAEMEENGASLLDTIRDAVTSGTYGLSALKDLIDAVPTAGEIQTELEENGASLLDTIRDAVTHGTYGLSALQTLIAALPDAAAIQAELEENGASVLDTLADAIAHGTYGLSALQTLIAALPDAAEIQAELEEDEASLLDDIADAMTTLLTRVPAEVAQKAHLVHGTGDITPPTNKGIWDALGDGSRSVSDLPIPSEIQTELEEDGASLLDTIRDAIGTPAAVDGGAATLAGMILKGLDDNGGLDFDAELHSLYALRVRGDAAWTTGGAGSIDEILNVTPMVPQEIDLADTVEIRFGLRLVNALDDLPSGAEITAGTITISRKAIGGTSWTVIVNAAACSKVAGMIYYDEVVDSATGYAEGDTLKIEFLGQKITVAANDHEIVDGTNPITFYTRVAQTMRGTDSAALASVATEARLAELDAGNLPSDIDDILGDTGEVQAALAEGGFTDLLIDAIKAKTDLIPAAPAAVGDIPTVAEIQAELEENGASVLDTIRDAIENGTYGLSALKTLIDAITDDTNELQTDLVNGGRLDLIFDAIKTVTDALSAKLPSKPYLAGSADADGGVDATELAVIKTAAVAALNTDTYGEPGQGDPPVTTTIVLKLGYLYKAWRNKKSNDATTKKLFADDGSTVDQKAAVSEAAGTVTDNEWQTGP